MHCLKCRRMRLFRDREKYQMKISIWTEKCYLFKNPSLLNLKHVFPHIVRLSTTVMIPNVVQRQHQWKLTQYIGYIQVLWIPFSNLKHISSQIGLTPQSRFSKMLRSTSANDGMGAKSKSRRDSSFCQIPTSAQRDSTRPQLKQYTCKKIESQHKPRQDE